MKARFIQPQVNTVGLICRLKLHEGTAFDYSLNGHNGTLTGTTLTYRYPGLDLEGADEHIVIADHADFTPILTPLSISAWVYMHSATNFKIISKGVYNTDGEWTLYTSGAGKIYVEFYDESVNNCYIGRIYNTALSNNTWYHIVTTYDGGKLNSSIKVYLDGTKVDDTDNESNPASFDGVEAQSHDVWIGRYGANYADGLIDNAMIFNVEKSAAEVKSIYEVTRRRYGV